MLLAQVREEGDGFLQTFHMLEREKQRRMCPSSLGPGEARADGRGLEMGEASSRGRHTRGVRAAFLLKLLLEHLSEAHGF